MSKYVGSICVDEDSDCASVTAAVCANRGSKGAISVLGDGRNELFLLAGLLLGQCDEVDYVQSNGTLYVPESASGCMKVYGRLVAGAGVILINIGHLVSSAAYYPMFTTGVSSSIAVYFEGGCIPGILKSFRELLCGLPRHGGIILTIYPTVHHAVALAVGRAVDTCRNGPVFIGRFVGDIPRVEWGNHTPMLTGAQGVYDAGPACLSNERLKQELDAFLAASNFVALQSVTASVALDMFSDFQRGLFEFATRMIISKGKTSFATAGVPHFCVCRSRHWVEFVRYEVDTEWLCTTMQQSEWVKNSAYARVMLEALRMGPNLPHRVPRCCCGCGEFKPGRYFVCSHVRCRFMVNEVCMRERYGIDIQSFN